MKEKGILFDTEMCDIMVNVKHDAAGKITGGLEVGNVTQQNAAFIINMEAGEIKTAPTVGVGISSMINSHEMLLLKHRIREQLEADGLRVEHLKVNIKADNKTEIQINASY